MPTNQAPVFRRDDQNNLEFVRQIVFQRLRTDPGWHHMGLQWTDDPARQYVNISESRLHQHFVMLVDEVLWQLMFQGVITPGMDALNLNLPFFRVTDYGRQVLAAERFIPHDPTGYLTDVRAAGTTKATDVALAYLEEALRCFNAGCHSAATLLLGVATEAVFLRLCDIVAAALQTAADQEAFADLPDRVRPRRRWVVEKYQALPGEIRRRELPESLDVTLSGLYELIRRQRNELGHPQDNPPAISREQAFVFFRLLPAYLKDVEAFASYCKTNGL